MIFTTAAGRPLRLCGILDENDSVRRELLTAIDRAHLAIDWRKPGSEAFYESLKKALAVWNEEVSKISYTSPVTVHTVGHSHIDVAWALAAEAHQRKGCPHLLYDV